MKFSMRLHFACDCSSFYNHCPNIVMEESNYQSTAYSSVSIPKEMQDKIFNCKSSAIYNKWHDRFVNFFTENKLSENLESVLQFFNEISKSYAASTLWQAYSCLNKYYTTYKAWNDFKETPILKTFIKQIEKESAAKKKSLILSKEQLFTFLESDNNDDKKFLVRKAVAIMGYFGGLRCAELLALDFKDVAINTDSITVFVRSSKTDPQGKSQF